jgi:uncharacterized protein
MAHPNAEVVQAVYAALRSGDWAEFRAYVDPDVVLHVPGRRGLAGDYKGADKIIELWTSLAELTGGTLRMEAHDLLASDDHVVALISEHAERDGRSLDDNMVQISHVKNGKVTEVWNVYTDLYAHDEFLA